MSLMDSIKHTTKTPTNARLHFSLRDFHNALQQWYDRHGRKDLPWRNLARDGSQSYEVYVSEIMLQQTQVARVLRDFYFPFLRAFPTLQALARASQQEVLTLWQGLGYYTRAINLHSSAQICVRHYGGKLPRGVENLKKLPGIGSYTAGAISCFGFGESVGFVDANIKRVFSRLFALANPTQAQLQNLANTLVDTHKSFEYNQALLDVGAMLCANKPKCLLCPIMRFCKGRSAPHRYPQKILKHRENLHLSLFVITFVQSHTRFIALTRPSQHSRLYAGLYNVPMMRAPCVRESFAHIGRFKHAYTKYNITAEVLYAQCVDRQAAYALLDSILDSSPSAQSPSDVDFVDMESISSLPLSNLSRKALKYTDFNAL